MSTTGGTEIGRQRSGGARKISLPGHSRLTRGIGLYSRGTCPAALPPSPLAPPLRQRGATSWQRLSKRYTRKDDDDDVMMMMNDE